MIILFGLWFGYLDKYIVKLLFKDNVDVILQKAVVMLKAFVFFFSPGHEKYFKTLWE